MTASYRLNLRITPNARKNEVTGVQDGIVCIKIKAPPVEGRANTELVNYLKHLLGISKSNINLIRGHTSRNKTVEVIGLNAEEISSRMGLE